MRTSPLLVALLALSHLAYAIPAQGDCSASDASCSPPTIPHAGNPGTVTERTFVAIKPDAVQRGLVGTIISRFERKGYQLVGLKMLQATKEQAAEHYAELSSKPFFGSLVDYFSSGPIVAMAWQGLGVIDGARKLLGATNPADAAPGTIRFDHAVSISRNLVHASDSVASAHRELAHWFTSSDLPASWTHTLHDWLYE